MHIIKAIAIDDEPIALDVIRNHIEKVPYIELKETFASAAEALVYMRNTPVELVFLDINMPDLTGIDFSTMINPSVLIVFTTAYSEFALKGFELNALDYLLKPFSLSRFLQACQRASDRLSSKNEQDVLFIKEGNSIVCVDLNNFLYVQADDNYLTFYETNKKITVRHTLKDLSDKLPKMGFAKINKSCIVAVKKIDKIDNQYVVINNVQLLLAKNHREALLSALN